MADKVDTLFPDGPQSRGNLLRLWRESGQSMTVADAQGADLTDYPYIFASDLVALFFWDLTSTAADDDGITTIVDAVGNRFVRFVSGGGDGDVTAASNFGTDNRIIRSDGTEKGVQGSSITIDDSGNMSGIGTLATNDDGAIGATPMTYRFQATENHNAGTTLAVVNTDAGASASAQFRLQAGNGHYFAFQNYSSGTSYMFTNTSFVFGTYANTNITVLTNTTANFYFHNTGEFSVGTATKTAKLVVNGAVRIGQYTVATVPSASANGAGSIIYVSDETGGAIIAFSDGTNWRRSSDRAIIS